MTLRERILDVLFEQPGLTDRELTDLLLGKKIGQQAVNSECRLLRNQRLLRREKGEDGRHKNVLIDPTAPAQAGDLWSEGEVAAAVRAYLDMLAIQERGERPSKAQVNRDLRAGPLSGRSASSVEQRMQNITAVLQQLEQPTLDGYAPLENVGKVNWARIVAAATPELENLPTVIGDLPDVVAPPPGNEQPTRKQGTTNVFDRDKDVVAWVLKRAGHFCEGCLQEAPFITAGGRPFLEVHHVKHLAANGPDTPENTVALCPNCHRKVHYASGDEIRQFEKILLAYLQNLP